MQRTQTVSIRELVWPSTGEAPSDDLRLDAEAIVAILNDHREIIYGFNDLNTTVDRWLSSVTEPIEYDTRVWVAELDVDGEQRIVGYARADVAIQGDPELVYPDVVVAPDARRQGIGQALATTAIEALLEAGQRRFECWLLHASEAEEWIDPPTGFGRVPADDLAAKFATRFGLRLGQVERVSTVEFDGDAQQRLAELRDEAQAAAGDDYRVHAWAAPTPEQWVADVAHLKSRMHLDAPSGELEVVQEQYTEERVRENEARNEKNGIRIRYVAVEHVPSGQLVAHNVLIVDTANPGHRAEQSDTLVLKEHRGHRLGWLVKTEGLLRLLENHPETPGVITWNAEENRPMLSVNEKVGFRPLGFAGGWQGPIRPAETESDADSASGENPA